MSAVSTTGDFSETTNCSSIAIGAQCSVAIAFTPTQTGPRSGRLSITDNIGGSPQFIALSGTGTDFALQAATGSPLSATMAPGSTATYNLAVTPLSGFTGIVALSCRGAPAGSSCTPSVAGVNVNGAAVPITVFSHHGCCRAFLSPLTVAVPGGYSRCDGASARRVDRRKKRRRFLAGWFCLALLVYVSGLVGCGGGSGGGAGASASSAPGGGTTQPSPATSMLTLSGISGTQTRTVGLTLTVQ